MNSNSVLQDAHFRRRPANLLHRTETHVPSHHIQHWIAGQAVNSADNATFSTQLPDDNETYSKTCSAATSEVAAAVAAAEEAAESFRQTLPDERESILLQAATVIQQRSNELTEILINEIGSPISKAKLEIAIAIGILKAHASLPRRMSGRTYPDDATRRLSFAKRQPLGIVAGITPFNVPLVKGIKHSSVALATGNPFVWLPSQQTPVLANAVAEIYSAAGLPPGAFNIIHGDGKQIGDSLTSHPAVRMVSFTGSAAVGKHIQAICGAHGKRLTLELGGSNALIVLADAKIDAAVQAAALGSFLYQGQICLATSRMIVQEAVADEFREKLIAKANALPLGPLTDPSTVIGPLINEASKANAQQVIDDAISNGATVECGNQWTGNRLHPTILSQVTASMRIAQEEVFAPIASLQTARDSDHALQLANSGPGMLVAAVFGSDLKQVLPLTDQLAAGMVHVNQMTIQQDPMVPFGGEPPTGFGREGVETAIDDYTTWKWVTVKP